MNGSKHFVITAVFSLFSTSALGLTTTCTIGPSPHFPSPQMTANTEVSWSNTDALTNHIWLTDVIAQSSVVPTLKTANRFEEVVISRYGSGKKVYSLYTNVGGLWTWHAATQGVVFFDPVTGELLDYYLDTEDFSVCTPPGVGAVVL